MRIGKKELVCAMIDADLNATQLSSVSGISRATISNVINGKSCNEETMRKLAKALNVKTDDLLTKKEGE